MTKVLILNDLHMETYPRREGAAVSRNKRNHIRRCGSNGKVKYDETTARKKAHAIIAEKGLYLHAYECPHCRSWHVGHVKLGMPKIPAPPRVINGKAYH